PGTISAPFEVLVKTATACSIAIVASRRLIETTSTPNDGAAVWIAPHWPIPAAMVVSRRTAARLTPGAICLSSSSHFAPTLYSHDIKPVVLPPGRARQRLTRLEGVVYGAKIPAYRFVKLWT